MSKDTHGVLGAIDGALRDYEVSAGAMRWVPEEGRESRPEEERQVVTWVSEPSPALAGPWSESPWS